MDNSDKSELKYLPWWHTDADEADPMSIAQVAIEDSPKPGSSARIAAAETVDLYNVVVSHIDDDGVSDYYFTAGSRPALCIKNETIRVGDVAATDADIERFCNKVLDGGFKTALDKKDFSIMINARRMRGNIDKRWQGYDLAIRLLPPSIKTLRELGLPEYLYSLMDLGQGLILVCGPTGSGKSTTMASLIEHVNVGRPKKIVTIEDPIEYLIKEKASLVCQRELALGDSFLPYLRSAMRQHPNIIMVGEIRDRDTAYTALLAAETGHLVLTTMHTDSVKQTIDRFCNQFTDDMKNEVRTGLAAVLKAVIVQRLIRGTDGNIHIAYEICVVNQPIANCIRDTKENKLQQIPNMMMSAEGCVLMNATLLQLIKSRHIRLDEAVNYSYDPDTLRG